MKNLSIEEMSAEIQTLREFLDCLTQGLLSDSEVCERLSALVIEAKPFPTNPQCFLWTMFEWDDAPADHDAFVEFAVLPTYIATCILTYAYQKYTIASAVPDFMKTMVGAMNSCVKCGYGGHGYDSDVAFLEHMKYFAQARIDLFISHFPSFHSEFTNSIRAAFRHLENMASGRIVNVWTGKTYAEQREGIEIAKAHGKYKGRSPIPFDESRFNAECQKWKNGEQTAVETMKKFDMKPNRFYRNVKRLIG